jgi:formate hydrogenlyase subunit 5
MTARPSARRDWRPDVDSWRAAIIARVAADVRFAGMFATSRDAGATLTAVLVDPEKVFALDTDLAGDEYPSLTEQVPGAFWYERALHDLSGITPSGHPRLDPLLLPRDADTHPPRPGGPARTQTLTPAELKGPTDVSGHGMFTIPHGPVRSGVFESVEYLIETPGEDIPHLNIRPHYKHRGIAKSFEKLSVEDAVLVAERVEGISGVAHSLAFCHAIENLAGLVIDEHAGMVRVVHAELERIANHLDVAMRLCDAAGLAVATARFGWHKERVMRLVSALCGSRFGRGVVVPGGVDRRHGHPEPDWAQVQQQLLELRRAIEADARVLMRTASFLDRLRNTGILQPELAHRWGALGPIGRASGVDDDHRRLRPYDGYRQLELSSVEAGAGDAQARLVVRWEEISTAFDLLQAATGSLAELRTASRSAGPATRALSIPDGRGLGVAESAQGEVLHSVEVHDGRIVRCFARSASLHNLALFHDVFHGDIFTDFPFIEASFGLSIAGVAM